MYDWINNHAVLFLIYELMIILDFLYFFFLNSCMG